MKLIPNWILDKFRWIFKQSDEHNANQRICDAFLPVNLIHIQREHAVWVQRNFPDTNADGAFKGIVEELGELSHALLKQEQGIREFNGVDTTSISKSRGMAEDAVGDMFIYMLHLCSLKNWDMNRIINATWNEVKQRDWKRYPLDGKTPVDGEVSDYTYTDNSEPWSAGKITTANVPSAKYPSIKP